MNTWKNLTMDYKSSIMWIIYLQERSFAQGKLTGKAPCLGEFVYMVKLVKAKICKTISNVKVTTDLL